LLKIQGSQLCFNLLQQLVSLACSKTKILFQVCRLHLDKRIEIERWQLALRLQKLFDRHISLYHGFMRHEMNVI
jgi:hypothetical protein